MSLAAELSLVRVASLVVFAVSAWSVWQRRLTFQSRFDAGTTAAIALFGLGAVLDAPWNICATASYPVTGRFYGLAVIGHICYVSGAAVCNAPVYMRLLPDRSFGPFMRTRIIPFPLVTAAVLVTLFFLSSVPLTHSVEHLYLAAPDGMLSAYWIVDFGTAVLLGGSVTYGLFLLRGDPRSVMANVMLGSACVATAACALLAAWAIVTGGILELRLLAWLGVYVGFLGYAVAAAVQWRHRVQALYTPPQPTESP